MQMTSSKGNRRFIYPGAAVAELWVYSLMLKEKKKNESPAHLLPSIRRTSLCLLHPRKAPTTQALAFSRSLGAIIYRFQFLQASRDLGISTLYEAFLERMLLHS